jgi:two-component system chemotaxis response regulator CheY
MAKKILVVDDSSSVRTVARMALREHGYDVIEASNGKEALDMLNGERVHLVISDVNMPTMDGITLLKEIKRHPNYKFTPVIMLTTDHTRHLDVEHDDIGPLRFHALHGEQRIGHGSNDFDGRIRSQQLDEHLPDDRPVVDDHDFDRGGTPAHAGLR